MRGRLILRSLAAFHIESFVIFSHCRSSLSSSVSSCQIVAKFFSPVMHMNLHLVEASLASSPWINRQHLWLVAVFFYPEGFTQNTFVGFFSLCNFVDPHVRREVFVSVHAIKLRISLIRFSVMLMSCLSMNACSSSTLSFLTCRCPPP